MAITIIDCPSYSDSRHKMRNTLNQLGKKKIPFLFIIDFDLQKYSITPLNQLNVNNNILYSIDGFSNIVPNCLKPVNPFLKKKP
jgi:para-aminobenzoate synthetase component 1